MEEKQNFISTKLNKICICNDEIQIFIFTVTKLNQMYIYIEIYLSQKKTIKRKKKKHFF